MSIFSRSKKESIQKYIDTGVLGLEIGPSFNPIFSKSHGYKVKTLDHESKEGLLAKYHDLPNSEYDLSKVEDVDFVWRGEPYADLVGHERFNWILASHVAEHTPDFIGFINECASILDADGVLVLFVPDKRRTPDYFRQNSEVLPKNRTDVIATQPDEENTDVQTKESRPRLQGQGGPGSPFRREDHSRAQL